MPMRLPSRVTRLNPATVLAWLLITFLVLFPKGGFKIGSIPITWGYILLALCGPLLLVARLLAFPFREPRRLLGAAVCILPFQAIFLYAAVVNGISEIGIFISSVINFYYLPGVFLLLFPWFYPRLNGPLLARYFRFSILAAALFGIAMFFYHPVVGSYIEIPYLTVNSGDYGEIELYKHIRRGIFLKLISTYNNGNLYGVATLILLPLYNTLEPRRWKRYTLIVALILTLSRTVWAGLILQELFALAITLRTSFKRFPRVTPGPAIRAALTVASMVLLVLLGLLFNAKKLSFLFDQNLGGRASHPLCLQPSQLDSSRYRRRICGDRLRHRHRQLRRHRPAGAAPLLRQSPHPVSRAAPALPFSAQNRRSPRSCAVRRHRCKRRRHQSHPGPDLLLVRLHGLPLRLARRPKHPSSRSGTYPLRVIPHPPCHPCRIL